MIIDICLEQWVDGCFIVAILGRARDICWERGGDIMGFVCGAAGECLEIGELRGSVGWVLDPEISKLASLIYYAVVVWFCEI
jgi:hypothetical protein